jgi:hypothetical protein
MKLIHIQGQFLSFLDTYSSRKLYFSENICIGNKVEYLAKGASYQNSIKEIIKSF